MLSSKAFGISVGVLATFAALASAQTIVKLKSNAGKGPLQMAIAELTIPPRLKAAQQRLWQAGEAAVPLLTAEVERGGAAERAALFVLEQLSGEAEAAVPVLQRIVANKATEPNRRDRIAATLAKIDGPPMLLVPLYMGGAVVEYDFEGNEKRRVVCQSAWGAWPAPDDRISALSFSPGKLQVLTWAGKEIESRILGKSTGSVVPLDGTLMHGAMIFTSWKQPHGELIRIATAGKPVWTKEIDATRAMRDFGDELLVLTRTKPRMIWFSFGGVELQSIELPDLCRCVRPLRGGGFLAASQTGKVYELGVDGSKLSEFVTKGKPNDMVRLRDGRTFVSTDKTVAMYAADGSEAWCLELGYCGPLFVRTPARGGK